MTETSGFRRDIVAIGGLGGSGTRLGAALLQHLGLYIGTDLNDALDNLWYTLLFKRRPMLMEPPDALRRLIELFFARMSGVVDVAPRDRQRLDAFARDGRPQHPEDWLAHRVETILDGAGSEQTGRRWGWKEPNTHVLAPLFLQTYPDLKYIHFERDPFYMASSSNKNQLELWGPILLGRDVTMTPRDALTYWCAVHRRVMDMMERWPERTLLVSYDAFCALPLQQGSRVAEFLGVPMTQDAIASAVAMVDLAKSKPRQSVATASFDPRDLQYLSELGYAF
jgi:hypothetical protein